MILADLHTHTKVSHGVATVEEMYAAARAAGLEYLGISEHSPLPPGFSCRLYQEHFAEDFPALCDEVLALARQEGSPRLLLGIELDWIPSNMPYMRDLLAGKPFDYVIGSLHFLGEMSIGFNANWDCPVEEAFRRFEAYYQAMADMARSGLIHIASHPDFIKLHCFDLFQEWLYQPLSRLVIGEAMQALRQNNVLLEVSSAGLRQPFCEPYPGPMIMDIAAREDVRISLASDAHRPEDVAGQFDELARYARSYGYRESGIVVGGERRFLPF